MRNMQNQIEWKSEEEIAKAKTEMREENDSIYIYEIENSCTT